MNKKVFYVQYVLTGPYLPMIKDYAACMHVPVPVVSRTEGGFSPFAKLPSASSDPEETEAKALRARYTLGQHYKSAPKLRWIGSLWHCR